MSRRSAKHRSPTRQRGDRGTDAQGARNPFNRRCVTECRAIGHARRSFTLVELLVSISMITLLAASFLFALYGVMENAKEVRTRSQIAKLHELIMNKWEGYRTRAIRLNPTVVAANLPTSAPNGSTGINLRTAYVRLWALREQMRLELPERVTDVGDAPVLVPSPAVWISYNRAAVAANGAGWYSTTHPPAVSQPYWSYEHQGSECLFLILANMREGDTNALDFLMESEIGDVDMDGMREVLDGWGRPIEFLRWAPGYATISGADEDPAVGLGWGDAGVDDDGQNGTDDVGERGFPGTDDYSELQIRDATVAPDPFDPLKVDPRWINPVKPRTQPYALFPLLISAGKDGDLGVAMDYDTDSAAAGFQPFHHASSAGGSPPKYANDPYYIITPSAPTSMFGCPTTAGADDNISNHLLERN